MRLVLAMLLSALALIVYGIWINAVQPEVMTDLAIGQLERSDENAHAMRIAQSLQNYVLQSVVTGWLLGLLCIYFKYIWRSISFMYRYIVPVEQE